MTSLMQRPPDASEKVTVPLCSPSPPFQVPTNFFSMAKVAESTFFGGGIWPALAMEAKNNEMMRVRHMEPCSYRR